MSLPYLLEPQILADALERSDTLIIDLCKADQYAKAHVPGAITLDYANIVAAKPPVMGLLPDKKHLQTLFGILGITPNTHIVAYDDEGGGKAARLMWTLAAVGHANMSLLNGGIHAWSNEGFPIEATPCPAVTSKDVYPFEFQSDVIANQAYILEFLDNRSIALLDARSEAEYRGVKKFAERAGHIPGAVNLDWIQLMDQNRNLRLKDPDTLLSMLQALHIDKSQEVIVYCQTHHRSALSFVALKSLGFENVRGYPGSWSDWGNTPSTPVELS